MAGVQRRATKMVLEIKNLSYLERLEHFKLPTMAYHRAHGDIIEVYKIIHEILNALFSQIQRLHQRPFLVRFYA